MRVRRPTLSVLALLLPAGLLAAPLASLTPSAGAAGPPASAVEAGGDFAGPPETPFFCETTEFRTADGSMLPAASAPACDVPVETDYVYQRTTGGFAPLPTGEQRPDDLDFTTVEGTRVPFIVRVQTGVADRGIYELAVLDDPDDAVEPDATTPSPGWNERLVYTFGGGCRGGWYRQGTGTGGVLIPSMLERGFAVASNSLNVFGHNCDDLLSAEVMAQTKQVFTETFGAPRWTIGWGCSGGSYQGHQIADNYPGLLDGVIAGCSFPDVGFGTSQMLFDSRVLKNWFDRSPGAFTSAQQQAVAGFGVPNALASMSDGAKRLDPDAEFDASVPAGARYDALTNPTGARGTIWDHGVNAYGTDPETGFARVPSDNVGVQYGWRPGARARSPPTSSSTSTRGSAASTSTPSRSRSAPSPTRWHATTPTRPDGCSTAATAWATCRSSTTAPTPTSSPAATSTCATSRSAPARAWWLPTAMPATR